MTVLHSLGLQSQARILFLVLTPIHVERSKAGMNHVLHVRAFLCPGFSLSFKSPRPEKEPYESP